MAAVVTPARKAAVTGPLGVLVAAAALAMVGLRPAAPVVAEPESPAHRVVGPDAMSCPALPPAADGAGSPRAVGAVVPDSNGLRPGQLVVRPATGAGAAALTLDRPGTWRSTVLAADEAADLTVTVSDGLAVGAAAYVLQRPSDGGLALQRCAAPARRWWFVGAGSSASRESTLVLVNLDEADAVVDVELRGADGPLEANGTDGLRIPPGERVNLALSALVAGEHEVAIDVAAVQGRVVAAVADEWSGVGGGDGSDWLPASPPPATAVLLPGLQDPDRASRLVIANPSDTATPVDVSVVDDSGTFAPTGGPQVLVPAAGVVSVRLPDLGQGSGLLVEADVPVNAAVRVGAGPQISGDADIGYAVQGPPLDGPAVVPVDLGRRTRPRLHLAASLAAGAGAETPPARTVTITAYDAFGTRLASADVEVAAATALVIDPRRDIDVDASDRAATAYLVVTPDRPAPGAGALVATAELRDAAGGLAMFPLETGLVRVTVPVVTATVVP